MAQDDGRIPVGEGGGRAALLLVILGVVGLAVLGMDRVAGSESELTGPGRRADEGRPPESVPAPRAPRPDVLVLAFDGLGPGALLGGATPNLTRVLGRAVAYTDTYATSPWAGEVLVSALTGRLESGARAGKPQEPGATASTPSLAEELEHIGYRTGLVAADRLHVMGPKGKPRELRGFQHRPELEGWDAPGGVDAAKVVDAASGWLTEVTGPALLVCTLADGAPPHHHFRGVMETVDAELGGMGEGALPVPSGLAHAELLRRAPEFGTAEVRTLELYHATELAYMDRCVGSLIAAIEARRATPPIVVVLGLRAPALGEAGRFGLLPSLSPAALRVPLVVTLPAPVGGTAPVGEVPAPVSVVDLTPTLLDALGVIPRLDVEGRSILPGARAEGRTVVASTRRGLEGVTVIEGNSAVSVRAEPAAETAYRRGQDGLWTASESAPPKDLAERAGERLRR